MTEIVGGISQNQILAEIQKALAARALQGRDDGISCKEIAEATGISVLKARDLAKRLLAEGKLQHADIVRANLHGQPVGQKGFKLPPETI